MDDFHILQLWDTFSWPFSGLQQSLTFSIIWWNSCRQINLFPGVCRYYYICKFSIINFIKCNGSPFRSSWLLFFLFSSQECGSDRCRWRPDCATYCPASRWRHAKRRLCVLWLKKRSCWIFMGIFECPSTESSSEICTVQLKHELKYLLKNLTRKSPF